MKLLAICGTALILLTGTAFSGCAGESSSVNNSTKTITESGSTTVQPLAELLAEAFMAENEGISVLIQGGGSSVGIKAAADGTVDIGASSRELTSSDPAINKFLLAKDGIAVIVNPKNPINNFSIEQIREIFAGNITIWSEVGGSDDEIHLAVREEGSGTRTAFQDMVMDDSEIAKYSILQSANGAIIQVVKSDVDAIGFISFGYVSDLVKAISIDGTAATNENAADGSYPIVRPLYFVTGEEPSGIVKTFIDYCTGTKAQEIIIDEGYISVN